MPLGFPLRLTRHLILSLAPNVQRYSETRISKTRRNYSSSGCCSAVGDTQSTTPKGHLVCVNCLSGSGIGSGGLHILTLATVYIPGFQFHRCLTENRVYDCERSPLSTLDNLIFSSSTCYLPPAVVFGQPSDFSFSFFFLHLLHSLLSKAVPFLSLLFIHSPCSVNPLTPCRWRLCLPWLTPMP